jgi:hypothetical protein
MRRPPRNAVEFATILLVAVGLLVQACEEQGMEPTGPELAAAGASRTLKVTGGGTGSGKVTAPSIGGAGALDCRIAAEFRYHSGTGSGKRNPSVCTAWHGP